MCCRNVAQEMENCIVIKPKSLENHCALKVNFQTAGIWNCCELQSLCVYSIILAAIKVCCKADDVYVLSEQMYFL